MRVYGLFMVKFDDMSLRLIALDAFLFGSCCCCCHFIFQGYAIIYHRVINYLSKTRLFSIERARTSKHNTPNHFKDNALRCNGNEEAVNTNQQIKNDKLCHNTNRDARIYLWRRFYIMHRDREREKQERKEKKEATDSERWTLMVLPFEC